MEDINLITLLKYIAAATPLLGAISGLVFINVKMKSQKLKNTTDYITAINALPAGEIRHNKLLLTNSYLGSNLSHDELTFFKKKLLTEGQMKQFGKNKRQLEYVKKDGKIYLKLKNPTWHLGLNLTGYIIFFIIAFIFLNVINLDIEPQTILYLIAMFLAFGFFALSCIFSFFKTLNNYELAKEINGEDIEGSTLMNIIKDKEILRKNN